MLTPAFVTAKSSLPAPLKSPTATDWDPGAPKFTGALKVPSPLPRSTLTFLLPACATARASLPSPLQSRPAADVAVHPAGTPDALRPAEDVRPLTSNNA